jgi:hypothetical protein
LIEALIWVSRVSRSTEALRSAITSSAKSLGEKGSHYRHAGSKQKHER